MNQSAIFLCMVIGFACVDSQRIETGEDDFKADQDARKAASLDANQTTTVDKAIRSKDVLASAHSSDCTSNETEDSEKPSSATMLMNVTSEGRKFDQKACPGKPAYDLEPLLSHRNISSNSTTGDKRHFQRQADDASFDNHGPVGLAIELGWQFQRTEGEFGLDGKPKPASRPIEGLEDLKTQWIIYQMIGVRIRVPRISQMKAQSIEYLVKKLPKQICREADILLVNVSNDCWKEVVTFRNSQAAYFKSGSGVAKYLTSKMTELEIFRPLTEEMIAFFDDEPLTQKDFNNDATSFEIGFDCPKTYARYENDSEMHAQVIMICLCAIIRFFGIYSLLIAVVYNLNDDLNANVNARRNKRSFDRVEQIGNQLITE